MRRSLGSSRLSLMAAPFSFASVLRPCSGLDDAVLHVMKTRRRRRIPSRVRSENR